MGKSKKIRADEKALFNEKDERQGRIKVERSKRHGFGEKEKGVGKKRKTSRVKKINLRKEKGKKAKKTWIW